MRIWLGHRSLGVHASPIDHVHIGVIEHLLGNLWGFECDKTEPARFSRVHLFHNISVNDAAKSLEIPLK